MKKPIYVLLLAIMVLMLAACGGDNKDGNKDAEVDIEALFNEIKEAVAEDRGGEMNGLVEANLLGSEDDPLAEMLVTETELTDDTIAAGYILASAMNVNSDAIILVEAKDADKVAEVEDKLAAYQEQQNSIWEMYLPDQHEKVKNTIIKAEGNYLIYITYEDPEAIEAIFTKAF